MPRLDNSSSRLVKTLKVLRVIYAILLVPAGWATAFGLFIFAFGGIEKRLIDWAYLFYYFLIVTSMVAATISTGSLIRRGYPKRALVLYLVPIALVAGLLIFEEFQ